MYAVFWVLLRADHSCLMYPLVVLQVGSGLSWASYFARLINPWASSLSVPAVDAGVNADTADKRGAATSAEAKRILDKGAHPRVVVNDLSVKVVENGSNDGEDVPE